MQKSSKKRARRLVTQAEAARRVGISRAGMTQLCQQGLKGAVVGKKVDIDSDVFRNYVKNRKSSPTLDPLYQPVLAAVIMQESVSADWIIKTFQVGQTRAEDLLNALEKAGLVGPSPGRGRGKKRPVLLGGGAPAGGEFTPDSPIDGARVPADPPRPTVADVPALTDRPEDTDGYLDDDDDEFYSEVGEFVDWTLRKLLNQFGSSSQFKNWLDARKSIEDIKLKELNVAEKRGELISREFVRVHVISLIENLFSRLLADYPKTLIRTIYPLIKSGGSKEEAEKLIVDLLSSQLKEAKEETQRKIKKA